MAGKRRGFGLVEDTSRVGTTINPRNRGPMNHLPRKQEDDYTNPSTGRPYWDEKAKTLPGKGRKIVDGSDRGGYPIDQTARAATVNGGRVNKDGADRGSASLVQTYAAQRRRAGTKGY